MRLLVFERYLTWFHYVAFLAANGVYYLAYRILNNAASERLGLEMGVECEV